MYSWRLRNIDNRPWSLSNEIEELRGFDIGVMPMPDNEWTKGKCGFKLLQYMACGLSVVASPVGVNLEIVDEDKNGYFAITKDDWVSKLSILIENDELRNKMGINGREKIINKYSLNNTKIIFYGTLIKVYKER